MIPRPFQQDVLDKLDAWFDALKGQKANADGIAAMLAANPTLRVPLPDWTQDAWADLAAANLLPDHEAAAFNPRRDGCGNPVPTAVLKVPTGGGKTFLAAAGVGRAFNRLFNTSCGLVLWVVPNEAIFSQTLRRLQNRADPYRQMLERAGAGRIRIFTKGEGLDRRDVETHLCVLVLMLQSANRETRERLKMFQDKADIRGFFPPDDGWEIHAAMKRAVPNLRVSGTINAATQSGMIIHSLGNALALLRPVVVLDEGHRAYSALARQTIADFNPRLVLELSATPAAGNWLVNVRGTALRDAEMIRLPIHVDAIPGNDWRDALRRAWDQTQELDEAAQTLRMENGRYVRPILLVQVEATGKSQRRPGVIHALDARDHLLALGLRPEEVILKTAETDEMGQQDLLSPACPVRAIITRSALGEGWDCPFAYVLCCLAANHNLSALTQLVGRVLRMPGASLTSADRLNAAYVFAHGAGTAAVVAAIKHGLEQDGMGDLAGQIRGTGAATSPPQRRLPRREALRDLPIFLPQVIWCEEAEPRVLDYEADILAPLDTVSLDMNPLIRDIPLDGSHVQLASSFTMNEAGAVAGQRETMQASVAFDPLYAVRALSDLLPNSFLAHAKITTVLNGLRAKGATERQLGGMSDFLLTQLRQHIGKGIDTMAEARFAALLATETIQFRLRADALDWPMPDFLPTTHLPDSPKLEDAHGERLSKPVFPPAYRADFNPDEANVACHLDGRATLDWWHRNVARSGWAVQGWKRGRVYPDFIFAKVRQADGSQDLVALETKGDQLGGNLDSRYKERLLDLLSDHYREDRIRTIGTLSMSVGGSTQFQCRMVLISEWTTRLPKLVN